MNDSRLCQFCRRDDDTRVLIQYSVRHYAHGKCLIDHVPTDRILRLKTHPLSRLPALALQEHGILALVERELAKRREAA